MRGLTPVERARLSDLITGATSHRELTDEEVLTTRRLVASGRARSWVGVDIEGDVSWLYEGTDAGRLALRLWPATAATPGAGEGR